MRDQAEQMKGLRMTRVHREDLAAQPLRLGRTAAALMIQRRAAPLSDSPGRGACRAAVLPKADSGAPLLSVHQGLIAQPAVTYPSSRENSERLQRRECQ